MNFFAYMAGKHFIMDNEFTSGALLVTLLVFAAREFFGWISKRSLQQSDERAKMLEVSVQNIAEKTGKMEIKVDSMLHLTRTMYDWHDISDEDGVKIWYVRRSLEEALQENVRAINILAKNSETQTKLLEELIHQQKEIHKDQVVLSKLLEKFIDRH